MSQIGHAVTCARFAGAPRIERPEVRAVPRVLEVDAAILGQGRAVSGQARRQHAVEHVYPERYDLQDADGVPDPHEVPWLLGGQPGRSERQRLQHLLPGLTYRETPHSVAVEPYLDCQPEALFPQVGVKPALHDPEEGLISPPVRLLRLRAHRPVRRSDSSWYSRPALAGGHSSRTIATSDRKSTRLNSSHANISYAVFCLKKKKKINTNLKLHNKKTKVVNK